MRGTPFPAPRSSVASPSWRCLGIAGLLLVLAAAFPLHAEDPALEYRVKSGFLFNFLKFVEWPSNTFATPSATVVVGVMEDDPAATVVLQMLGGKPVTTALSKCASSRPPPMPAPAIWFSSGAHKPGARARFLSNSRGLPC